MNVSNCDLSQKSSLELIENEINLKSIEKGKKKSSHPILWKSNSRKILKNSVKMKKNLNNSLILL
jgi:hypothetical protein